MGVGQNGQKLVRMVRKLSEWSEWIRMVFTNFSEMDGNHTCHPTLSCDDQPRSWCRTRLKPCPEVLPPAAGKPTGARLNHEKMLGDVRRLTFAILRQFETMYVSDEYFISLFPTDMSRASQAVLQRRGTLGKQGVSECLVLKPFVCKVRTLILNSTMVAVRSETWRSISSFRIPMQLALTTFIIRTRNTYIYIYISTSIYIYSYTNMYLSIYIYISLSLPLYLYIYMYLAIIICISILYIYNIYYIYACA